MKIKTGINNLIILFPIVIVTYFLRLGESSVYLFDIYFLILFLCSIKYIERNMLYRLMLMVLVFIIISFLGLFNNIIFYQIELQLDRFFAGVYRYSQLIYTLGFLSTYKKIYDIEKLLNIKKVFLFSISFPLLYAVFFYFLIPEKVIVFNRLASYFGNPNFLGAYICLSIMPIVYILSKVKKIIHRLFYLLILVPLILFNLVYAGSNSYWILSVVTLLLALFSISNSLSSYVKVVAYFTLSTIILYFLIGNINFNEEFSGVNRTLNLIETVFSGGNIDSLGSGEFRDDLVRESIEFSFSSVPNLLFGIGLGQSPIIIGAVTGGFVTAHNAHIVILMEMGIWGYFYFIFILIYFILEIKLSKVSICFLISYLISMMATPHVYMPFLWGLMVYGLFIYRLELNKENKGNMFSKL